MSRTYRQSRASGRDIKDRTVQPRSKFWKRTTQRRSRHNAVRFISAILSQEEFA